MLVTGRSLARRFFRVSLSIENFLVGFGGTRGNDADAIVLELDVHQVQQPAKVVETDHRIARFVVA